MDISTGKLVRVSSRRSFNRGADETSGCPRSSLISSRTACRMLPRSQRCTQAITGKNTRWATPATLIALRIIGWASWGVTLKTRYSFHAQHTAQWQARTITPFSISYAGSDGNVRVRDFSRNSRSNTTTKPSSKTRRSHSSQTI